MEASRPVNPAFSFDAVLQLIATLRSENGCPWDRVQTPQSLTVYLIEETYELVQAIIADDTDAIREEMGDVVFQILFLLDIFRQAGRFGLDDMIAENLDKMIRRHPHVFGNAQAADADQVRERWRQIKQQEKSASADRPQSLMDSVPSAMPALMRSFRVSERAAGIGFDWPDLRGVLAQVESEWREFKCELHLDRGDRSGPVDSGKVAMEFGDVLFSMVNAARMAGIHPEVALNLSTQKFIERFQKMESMAVEQNRRLEDFSPSEKEDLWRQVKNSA